MSGHLLQTVNPEAAAEEHEVPETGSRVIYYARPGQGRGGQLKYAADVLFTDARKGTATLWVLFGREDYREIEHVRRRTDQEPYGSWDYPEDGLDDLIDNVSKLNEVVVSQADEITALKRAIFGDFSEPVNADGSPKSIIGLLAEFEQRVFAAERRVFAAERAKK